MVGHLDDIEIMLNDDDGVALVDEPLQNIEEDADVLEVQARRGFVEDKDGAPRITFRKLSGEFHTLAFTARKRGGRLPKANVPQTHFLQGLDFLQNGGDVFKKLHRLIDGHIEHIGNAFALIAYFERLAVIAASAASLATHEDIGEEIHLYRLVTVAAASLAATTFHIEGEAAGLVGTHL